MLTGIINLDEPPCLPQDLGIELSENSNIYAHDNGTTLGVDSDSNFERRRDMVNMRSPDFCVKQSGFDSFSASSTPGSIRRRASG